MLELDRRHGWAKKDRKLQKCIFSQLLCPPVHMYRYVNQETTPPQPKTKKQQINYCPGCSFLCVVLRLWKPWGKGRRAVMTKHSFGESMYRIHNDTQFMDMLLFRSAALITPLSFYLTKILTKLVLTLFTNCQHVVYLYMQWLIIWRYSQDFLFSDDNRPTTTSTDPGCIVMNSHNDPIRMGLAHSSKQRIYVDIGTESALLITSPQQKSNVDRYYSNTTNTTNMEFTEALAGTIKQKAWTGADPLEQP